MTRKPEPLTPEQVMAFREILQQIADLDIKHEQDEDYDAHEALINQLYHCGCTSEDFTRFLQVIAQADDPDARCPK